MNATCKDRDRIFEDGTLAEWAALETHAASCTDCAEEFRSWKSLSLAAQEMREYTESPALWLRIERALAEEAARNTRRTKRWGWLSFWRNIPLAWQAAAAGAFVLILTVSADWFYFRPEKSARPIDQSLLKRAALIEVERAESAYVQAIGKLAADAKPQLDNPATPLLANYREKLLVLDSAIGELRAQAEQNPGNAHLRRELLAMYQEKQSTLEQILEEKRQ
jgi:hypothetical protein